MLTDEHEHPAGGSTLLGFWIYLMSDCLLFAALFATYGVLGGNYAAGPAPEGSVRLAAGRGEYLDAAALVHHLRIRHAGDLSGAAGLTQGWLVVTALFGMGFVGIELYEFGHMIHEGATPQRSAFLSAFFTLVSTHGLHVTVGLIWMVTLMVQVGQRGLTRPTCGA